MEICTVVYMWIVHKALRMAEIQGWGVCICAHASGKRARYRRVPGRSSEELSNYLWPRKGGEARKTD